MGDLISRKAVIKALLEERERYPHVVGCKFNAAIRGGIRMALRITEQAPACGAVDAVHARWIGKPIAGYCTVVCSACRSAFIDNSGRWKFCPDCGAKMDGGENDS